MAAFLCRGELILKTHRCGSGFNQGFRELISIEDAAKTSFTVRFDGGKPVEVPLTFRMCNLISPSESVINFTNGIGYAADWIKAFIRIHLARIVTVVGHACSADIDRLKARPDLVD